MQESIGATLIFKIVMVFIVIFIALLALAVKYANAFVMKNNIINIIEKCEGPVNDCATPLIGAITSKLEPAIKPEIITDKAIYNENAGLCSKSYRVVTKINFQLPFVQGLIINISGQTKLIYDMSSTGTSCGG